jgi:hypothetical protein
MEISGVPLHPLVVHAVVMLVPAAVLLGWVHAFLTGWRWLTRWLALGASVAALAAVVVARQSGDDLLSKRSFLVADPASEVAELIATHQDRADVLFFAMIGFTLVTAVAFWALPAASGLTTGRYEHVGRDDVRLLRLLQLLSVVVGLVALVWVVLTGDAGARAVWS